jgi:4a-hydroxytetrahydrobiopterin dehydratase
MPKLSPSAIKSALTTVPQWRRNRKVIARTFAFKDFVAAIRFVRKVATLAEKAWHHPDIDIRWNKVTLTLTTHDKGALTENDFALAKKIDRLV